MSMSQTIAGQESPVVTLSTAFNFRDLGGLASADGRRVRPRMLYRSDSLHQLTADDIRRLNTVGLRTVLDLRTVAETATAPSVQLFGTEVFRLPVLSRTWDAAGEPLTDTEDPVAFLTKRYEAMLVEGRQAFVVAFELLGAQSRLPAVFHCAAGKDRTGVLAALILRVLGVPDETIIEDYARSADAMTRMVAWLGTHRPEMVERIASQASALMACPAEAMHAFLGVLDTRYGGAEAYLLERGAQETALAGLRRALLTP